MSLVIGNKLIAGSPNMTEIESELSEFISEVDEKIANKQNKSIEKTYEVSADMWSETSSIYSATIAHLLGSEPIERPFVDIDLSSLATSDERDAVRSVWDNIYRVSFNESNMILYSEEMPETDISVVIKAVI